MTRIPIWLRAATLLIGLGLISGACGPSVVTETPPRVATPSRGAQPADTPAASSQPEELTDTPSESEGVVALARQDLAERLDLPLEQIRVASIESVRWPDASLGCPQPGMAYGQVVTPGYRIVLEAGGQQYSYHSGGGNLELCEAQAEAGEAGADEDQPGEGQFDPRAAALVEEAKRDLGERFNITADEVRVRSVEAVQWRDSSLGCPKPGMSYLSVITPGYLIKLEARGRIYEYHAAIMDVVYCEEPN
jgi:hypothetical protein